MELDNRVVCGARRRRDGQPCQALSVPGKRRCKWHGGCSTGPRTAEGKARVAANFHKSHIARERACAYDFDRVLMCEGARLAAMAGRSGE